MRLKSGEAVRIAESSFRARLPKRPLMRMVFARRRIATYAVDSDSVAICTSSLMRKTATRPVNKIAGAGREFAVERTLDARKRQEHPYLLGRLAGGYSLLRSSVGWDRGGEGLDVPTVLRDKSGHNEVVEHHDRLRRGTEQECRYLHIHVLVDALIHRLVLGGSLLHAGVLDG